MSTTTRFAAISATLSALSSMTMYAANKANPTASFFGVLVMVFIIAMISFVVSAFATGDM
jgi:hypothetical protein